ncbi:hypothetical protein JFL43_12945 [Viridibacillus sp. YIM B01967]|uniref:DUF4309 domain-containing protein n=1 Tax=Viridibacillus soli TaxID=2798301 RepID=A0ABS1H8L7_9BACL|nr:hypothetical protein [Viridibacillus soli]MBK3495745.1 hypothetical protein [Viridibacillus soli]
MSIIVVLTVLFAVPAKSDAATYKAFVSKEWLISNQKEFKKGFPKKLSNGLTMSAEKYDPYWGDFRVPAVKKGSKIIWSASNIIDSEGVIMQYTYAKNGDVFINFSARTKSSYFGEIVGINKKGKVIFKKVFKDDKYAGIEFISSNHVQLTCYGKKGNHKFYKLTQDGKMTKTSYIDKEFATLAKQGELRAAPGNVGMTYRAIKKKNEGTYGLSESFLWHTTTKESYGFLFGYGKVYEKIYSKQKVVVITKGLSINQSEKETAKQLKRYFGKPVAKRAYKAGKYYVAYETYKGDVHFYLGTKKGINMLRFTPSEDWKLYHIK